MSGITLRIDGINSSSLLITQTDNKLKLEFPPGLTLEGYRSDYPIAASVGKQLNMAKLDVAGYAYGLQDYRWLIGYKVEPVAKADYDAGTIGLLPTFLYLKIPSTTITVASTEATDAGSSTLDIAVGCNTAWTYTLTGEGFSSTSTGCLGNGTVALDVAENPGYARTGVLTIHAGGTTSSCTITQDQRQVTVAHATDTFGETGGSTQLTQTVTTSPSGDTWTATTTDPWITVNTASGTDGQTVGYTVATNTGVARTGHVLLANGVGTCQIAVSQDSVTAAITVSETPISVTNSSGSGTRGVTINLQGATWIASSDASWLTVSPASQVGDGTLTYTYTANTGVERAGTISVRTGAGAAKTIVVTQAVATDAVSVTNPTVAVTAAYTPNPVTHMVTSRPIGVNWTAASDSVWLTVLTASGANGDVLRYTVAENQTTQRVGVITVTRGTQTATITVTQAAAVASNLALTPGTVSATASAGFGTVTLTGVLPLGAAWTATATAAWLTTDTPSGSGNQTLTLRWTENTDVQRSAELHLVCGTYTAKCVVTQASATASVSISSTSDYSVDAPGVTAQASGRIVTVRPLTGATTCTSAQAWCHPTLTLTAGVGEIILTVDANSTGAERTSIVTVGHASQQATVTVRQLAGQGLNVNLAATLDVSYTFDTTEVTAARLIADTNPIVVSSNVSWLKFAPVNTTRYGAFIATQDNTLVLAMVHAPVGTALSRRVMVIQSNPTSSPRSGTVTITCGAATSTCTVTQAAGPGVADTQGVMQGSSNYTAAGGSVTHTVTTNVTTLSKNAVYIDPTVTWLTSSGGGFISGSYRFSLVAAKNADVARSTRIVVVSGGKWAMYTITQATAANAITLSPNSIAKVPKAGATYQVFVSVTPTSLGWTVVSGSPTICSVTPATGVAGTYTALTFAPNPSTSQRSVTVTFRYGTGMVGTKSMTVYQSGT